MKITITDIVVNRINYYLGQKENLTVYSLANASGIPYPTLKSIMQKRTKSIDLKTIILIAYGLDISPSEFLNDKTFSAEYLNLF